MHLSSDQEHRAKRASINWSRHGGHWVFSRFDREDAYQQARLALLTEPDLSIQGLRSRIIDAVRSLVPGYRQSSILEVSTSSDAGETLVDESPHVDPEAWAQAQESIRYIRADPAREELAELTLAGTPPREIAEHYGVTHSRVCQKQRRLVEELLGTQPRR